MTKWIKWEGGECPVDDGVRVDVELRDSTPLFCYRGECLRWTHLNSVGDIVAYRVCEENTQAEPSVKPPNGIGDVTSNAKGAGARYNAGKTPLELIPLRLIVEERRKALGNLCEAELDALEALAIFQEGGGVDNLIDAIQAIGSQWDECAAVFEYGKRKYAEWNWAKGMPWSVPIACAARHILYGVMQDEENDKESGLPHRGHFICNIVMLWTYAHTYKEGDDRPKQWLVGLGGEAK
jgi:hypothetical protein